MISKSDLAGCIAQTRAAKTGILNKQDQTNSLAHKQVVFQVRQSGRGGGNQRLSSVKEEWVKIRELEGQIVWQTISSTIGD